MRKKLPRRPRRKPRSDSMETTLSGRMVEYEKCAATKLPVNMPIIMRLDGRAFHTFTRNFKKPFDSKFMTMMNQVGLALVEEINNARLAYLQSDEISILIYNKIHSDTWFGNNVQKMTSVSASLASCEAIKNLDLMGIDHENVMFDSRVFTIPEKDVANYFVWRQRDWERNSLHMQARAFYSQKELQGKNKAAMHEMLHEKDFNWNDLKTHWKRGRCILQKDVRKEIVIRSQWKFDNSIPIFTKDRAYIEYLLNQEETVA